MMESDETALPTSIPPLIIAAWAVFGLYAAVEVLFVIFGAAAKDSVESAFMFGYAAAAGLPLVVMFIVLYVGTVRRNRVGPWISIVLGAVSLIFLFALITA